MKITEAMRRKKGLEMIESLATDIEVFGPTSEDAKYASDIYRIAHTLRLPSCRKNHPEWTEEIDAEIRADGKERK